MPALFVFLLKVNIALLLFCAGYYLVLRHLTFYTLNRVYLVGAILFATVYPRINLDSFAQRHQQLTQPVQFMVSRLQTPAETLVKPLTQPIYWYWAEVLFFAGAAFLAMRLLMQLFSLYKVYRASKSANILGHSVRIIDGNGGPFSFWKNIYINPASYQVDELRSILQHEQVHTDELHTLDVLLAELSVIFYWFNPGVWLMRKAVRENIEFITDRKILKKGIDSKQYQYSLLSVSVASTQPGIANHFNISTLKKRIMMMNAKRSSKAKLTRYAFLVPLLLICLCSFSFSKAELVKKSKKTLKIITNTVVTLTNEAANKLDVKAVTELFQAKNTAKKPVADTVKPRRYSNFAFIYRITKDTITGFNHTKVDSIRVVGIPGSPINVINIRRDTTKKIKTLSLSYNFDFSNPDTNKAKIVLRGSRASSQSGVTIFLDGEKITDTRSIDPATVVSYDVLKNNPDYPNGVISITTTKNPDHSKNSAAGKNFKGLLISPTVAIDTVLYKKLRVAAGKNLPPDVVGNSVTTITVTGNDNKEALLKKMRGFNVAKDGTVTRDTANSRLKEITVMGYNVRRGMLGDQKKDSETSIDDLAGKLVIVDGVEATDKDFKVSAINIKSIAIKSGDEMTKKYGAKAKNGVVFITKAK